MLTITQADRDYARRIAAQVYRASGAEVHAQALLNGFNGDFDIDLVAAGIAEGRKLQAKASFPARLMAGLCVLSASIVVRIHGGKPDANDHATR